MKRNAALQPASTASLSVYRLVAANLDDSEDGGCDLIFPNDAEALAFATGLAREVICVQVWEGQRLVGLAYGKAGENPPES